MGNFSGNCLEDPSPPISPIQIAKMQTSHDKTPNYSFLEIEETMDQCDNPSKDLLNTKFLKTSVIASNNMLTSTSQLGKKKSRPALGINQQFQVPSKGKQGIVPKKFGQQKKTRLQYRVSLDLALQKSKEQSQTASSSFKQVSKLKLSDYQVFQGLKINKEDVVPLKNDDVYLEYNFLEKLGEGTFGEVYKATNRENGQYRAIKLLKKKQFPAIDHNKIMCEIDTLRKLDHPNIIKIYEAYFYNDNYYIVTQYCEGGCLSQNLKSLTRCPISSIKTIMRKLLSALVYMHARNIVHRDIKLQNIVLVNKLQNEGVDNYLDIRVIDFGLSKTLRNKRVQDKQKIGTYTHMAPECFDGIYSAKSDLWSAGVVLYQLISGENPFVGKSKDMTMYKIQKESLTFFGPLWKAAPLEVKDLLIKLLDKKISNRISAQQALKHPWFRQVPYSQNYKDVFLTVTQKMNNYCRGNNFQSIVEFYISFINTKQYELQELIKMFDVLDQNHDGLIDKTELALAYQQVGQPHSDHNIDGVLFKIGKSTEDKINFSQFVNILSDRTKLLTVKSLTEVFKYLDKNKSGYLSGQDLSELLHSSCQGEQVLACLNKCQGNKVSFQQFLQYFTEIENI